MTPTDDTAHGVVMNQAADMGLEGLLDRVKAATGPDRELDARILCATLAPDGSIVERSKFNEAWCVSEPVKYGKSDYRLWETPAPLRRLAIDGMGITASVDAALALVARNLPSASISLNQMPAQWQASIAMPDPDHPDMVMEDWFDDAPTAPLAILAALLSALISTGAK